jgi:hypothetical protein
VFTAYVEGRTFKPGKARVAVHHGTQKNWLQTEPNGKEADNLGELPTLAELNDFRKKVAAVRQASANRKP